MPRLACRSCGRGIYTTAPIESLFAEERRCPRCGASLNTDRRESDRRMLVRRANPDNEPGPPAGGEERRIDERRKVRRRRPGEGSSSSSRGASYGWVD